MKYFKGVGFVHIDEKTCEHVIEKLNGQPFNGGQMKIEYGQIGPKPKYDQDEPKGRDHWIKRHIRLVYRRFIDLWKACLLVNGIVENASKKLFELKFGVFGSIGKVEFLPYKNIGKFITRPRSWIQQWKSLVKLIFSFYWTSKSICWHMHWIPTWQFILRVSHLNSSDSICLKMF